MYSDQLFFLEQEGRKIDLLSMRQVAIDLYGEQIGSDLTQTQTFKKYVGGCCPENIALGTSKQRCNVAMLSCVGDDDQFGEYILNELKKYNVITEYITKSKNLLTALAILGICPPSPFPLLFYQKNCADEQYKVSDLEKVPGRDFKALLIAGKPLALEQTCSPLLYAIFNAKKGAHGPSLDGPHKDLKIPDKNLEMIHLFDHYSGFPMGRTFFWSPREKWSKNLISKEEIHHLLENKWKNIIQR